MKLFSSSPGCLFMLDTEQNMMGREKAMQNVILLNLEFVIGLKGSREKVIQT